MSTSYLRRYIVNPVRPVLWCEATVRDVCADCSTVMRVTVGEEVVRGLVRTVRDGRIRVGVAPGSWDPAGDDAVGEITLRSVDGSRGLQAIGWWSVTDLHPWDVDHAMTVLDMDVAGITLWNGPHHISTEDSARVAALLR